MADEKEKKKFQPSVTIRSCVGIAAFSYLNSPDNGKSKYADNKYKVQLVCDPEDFATGMAVRHGKGNKFQPVTDFRKVCEDFYKEALEVDDIPEGFFCPARQGEDLENDDGEVREEFKGKVVMHPKSKRKPKAYDAKRQALEVAPKAADRIKFVATLFAFPPTGSKKKNNYKPGGVSLQLESTQLIQKAAGHSGSADDFDEEDGYDSSSDFDDNASENTASDDDSGSDDPGDF